MGVYNSDKLAANECLGKALADGGGCNIRGGGITSTPSDILIALRCLGLSLLELSELGLLFDFMAQSGRNAGESRKGRCGAK